MRCNGLGLEQPVIFIMRTDPKPLGLIAPHYGECAELAADTGRPKPTNLLETK